MVKHTQTKQFIDKQPTNCLSMLDHFVGLVLKGLPARKNYILFLCLGHKNLLWVGRIKFIVKSENTSYLPNHDTLIRTLNLMPCSTKQTSRSLGPSGNKVSLAQNM